MKVLGSVQYDLFYTITGWAKYKDNLDPVLVKLFVNDKPVAASFATELNLDLKNKGIHPTGHCAFSFYISELPFELSPDCKIQIKMGMDEQEFPEHPFCLPTPSNYFSDHSNDRFFFLHIPKTAGTSFRHMLYDIFNQKVIYPNAFQLKENNFIYENLYDFQQFSKEKKESFRNIKLLMGHLPSSVINIMPPTTKKITFLRAPLDRAISNLFFDQNSLYKNLSIEEIFDLKKEKRYFDIQTRYLADNNMYKTPYFYGKCPIDKDGFDNAKNKLMNFDFYGIAERFSESIALAEKSFGWKFNQLKTLNVNPNKTAKHVPDYILKTLKENNQYDEELYRFAVEHFEKKIKGL